MNEKICIKSLLPAQLEQLMADLGEPKYRAKQIFKWLHQGVTSFDEMSDISKALRAKLEGHYLAQLDIRVCRKNISDRYMLQT